MKYNPFRQLCGPILGNLQRIDVGLRYGRLFTVALLAATMLMLSLFSLPVAEDLNSRSGLRGLQNLSGLYGPRVAMASSGQGAYMTDRWLANSGYHTIFESVAPNQGISIENMAELTSQVQSATQQNAGLQDATTNLRTLNIQSLALEKTLISPANGVVMVGDTLTFQLQITNTGSVTVTELNLSDTYDPAVLQYVTASVTPDGQTAGTITWMGNLGAGTGSFLPNLPLAPGASFTVTVDFEVIGVTQP